MTPLTDEQVATLEAARSVLLRIWNGHGDNYSKHLALEAALRIDALTEMDEVLTLTAIGAGA